MWLIWGSTGEWKDLGVVAERCPSCRLVGPCRIAGLAKGVHVYFIPVASAVTEAACTCGGCAHQFRCDSWRYKTYASPADADLMTIEELAERTNPDLLDRLDWERQVDKFGADPRFASVLAASECLRRGRLRDDLFDELRHWQDLGEGRRNDLATDAEVMARTMHFAGMASEKFPREAGCLIATVLCISVWSSLLWWPGLRGDLAGILATAVVGILFGTAASQAFQRRRIRRWVSEVVIPEGSKSGLDFDRFIALVEDIPPSGPHSRDELCSLRDHSQAIREALGAEGWIGSKATALEPKQLA
jgi:hypothetical protein